MRLHQALVMLAALSCAACSTFAASPRPSSSTRLGTATASALTTPGASSEDDLYAVTLKLDQAEVTASQPVQGVAELRPLSTGTKTIAAASTGAFGFQFASGDTTIEPIWPADCRSFNLSTAEPLTSPITKSGTVSASSGPGSASFYAGSDVFLTPGTWTVTAIAIFSDGAACASPMRQLRASSTVVVK